MKPEIQRIEIREVTEKYANKHNLIIDTSHPSAVIFHDIADNFHPDSYENIKINPEWSQRLNKPHQNIPGVKEMQSSNSSDALLMNIFCHPMIGKWKGPSKLFNERIGKISFGFPGLVHINGRKQDSTEIDMAFGNVICEAKLTESDFTQQESCIVERYDNLQEEFHVESLPKFNDNYANYQAIRNLLAAIQYDKKHFLLCDERRPDLVRSYMETVACLRSVKHRKKCRVVFWQEIASSCGISLRDWLKEKYCIRF